MKNNKIATAAKTLIGIVALSLVFCIGAHFGQTTPELQTPETTVAARLGGVEVRLVETTTVQYVDRPVTVTEYVERVKSVPVELRDFSELEELKQWLEDKKNVTTVRFQSPNVTVDCDDYALEMQQKALADGYLISLEIIGPGEYNKLFKNSELPPNTLHAINLVIIGNDAYYIEPQTGEVVFVAHLD